MKNKLALLFIAAGLVLAGWNGYAWISEASAGKQTMESDDIIVAADEEEISKEAPELSADDAPDASNPPEEEIFLEEEEKTPTEEEEAPPRDYEEYEKGDEAGVLLIPDINMKYPVYWGTDDDTLSQGVGYHEGDFTTPPDGKRHTVLSGHRDTVFSELGDLEDGTKMYIQFEDVQYEYEIQKTWITDAEDRSVIVDKDDPTLTLTTCYPFSMVGPAPDRYIIEAPLVDVTEME
ncbi:MAG: class D sortase [Alkalicoccus sp.]|uniref:Class D sortase n=1 Tax=Alkalicoccus sp. TaxID=2005376 RepID=A0A651DHR5_9BACI|nr:MAG: class D sortase [Alkalicoccus sp.]